MNKIITEALKDIKEWTELIPNTRERLIKYWLGQVYRQGVMDGLERAIEIRRKAIKE